MTISWQTARKGPEATGETDRAAQHEGPVLDGPEPSPEDAEIWPAIPPALADGDARRALLRDLVLRAMI
jgi:hypothetical protein